MNTWLGIDIGTSAVKALLTDDEQTIRATAECTYPVERPRSGWSEQEPEVWWRAVEQTIAELRRQAPDAFGSVHGLGLSGQMHGAVLLDASDRVLRPAILWNDGRAVAECAELQERVPGLGIIAGIPAMPGFTAPKLLWVKRHEPEVFARTARVLLPKDYIRLRLTGEYLTDRSDAAGTLWLDQARRCWSPDIVAACGLSENQLPGLVEGNDRAGVLGSAITAVLGLPEGVIVAGGAGDVAAGAVGIGAVDPGDAFVSLGTSAQYFVTSDGHRPSPESLIHAFAHALPGRWFQMAALLNGASTLAWVAGVLGRPIDGLLAETETAYRGPGSLLFLPYLHGERTPHNNPRARGVFFGIDADTRASDLVQAVLEGVAFSLAESQDCLAAAGTRVERLDVIGGGARSHFWMRLLAAILDRPITLYRGSARGPAFGAARLAHLAVTGKDPGVVCTRPAVERVIEADPALVDAYAEPSARFKRLYRALRDEWV